MDEVESRRVQVKLSRGEWLALYEMGRRRGGVRKVVTAYVREGLERDWAAEVDDE